MADFIFWDECVTPPPIVVGLGEILWDLLPSGRQLGGAPANFAYCSHLLGNRATVASRIGNDDLGKDVRNRLRNSGLDDRLLQADPAHPTGTVKVELDSSGQPSYEITQEVAWDFMEWTDAWESLAQSADAVCFGSLAQRSEHSRTTILKFVEATRKATLRVFDVNLRQKFFTPKVLEQSMQRSNVVKLNSEELVVLKGLLGLGRNLLDQTSFCRLLLSRYDLKFVCVTHGANGSVLCDSSGVYRHTGFKVGIKDTVGSGDAFTAGLVHGVLSGQTPDEMNDLANRMGAWVASSPGGMPPAAQDSFKESLMSMKF